MKMRFIFIVRDQQIKHKSGDSVSTRDDISKWENNVSFMAPFGKTSRR